MFTLGLINIVNKFLFREFSCVAFLALWGYGYGYAREVDR